MMKKSLKNKRSVKPRNGQKGGSNVTNDASVRILNKIPNLPYRVHKSTPLEGYSFATTSGAVAQLSFSDPSNTYATGIGSGLMRDWANLSAIFDQYKVNKVTHTFTLRDTASGDGSNCIIYVRHMYDLGFGTPTLTNIGDITNVVEKVFTSFQPVFTYSYVPKVDNLVYNSGILSAAGHEVRDMGWCDVNNPVQLLGCIFLMPQGTDSTQTLFVDTSYDISYRYIV
jgi:hypothetical protein